MLGRKRKSTQIELKQDKFLLKLYEILSKDEYSKIIHWSQNGTYIIITNIHTLSKKILPIYFNHQNYSSFVRQLNMYNFHKIRTEQEVQEQYFINESLNKFKTLNEIKNFKRKEQNKQKCLFFKDEDSKIKYTILPNKKEENLQNIDEKIELNENDDKTIEKLKEIISNGTLDKNIKEKIMIFLLNKSKENYEKNKEMKNSLNEIKIKEDDVNEQINKINSEIENQNVHLKKIKSLYFLLVSLLMRKNNFPVEKNGENKLNVMNNEINKNKNSNIKLFNFINRYIDYVGHKNIIGFTRTLKKNKLNLIQKNNSVNLQSLSNIVQKGETFSIKNDNFDFDDYLNKFEMLSFKSRKSNRFNDSFSFSAEDKNLNSSFSMIGGNNLFNMDFDNEDFNPNKNILGDDNAF
jgi:heat shock transcription factor 1